MKRFRINKKLFFTATVLLIFASATPPSHCVGIPTDALDSVFTRFYRGKNSTGDGTGIGLSLSKAIIETQGGSVAISSTLGKGTAFTVIMEKTRL